MRCRRRASAGVIVTGSSGSMPSSTGASTGTASGAISSPRKKVRGIDRATAACARRTSGRISASRTGLGRRPRSARTWRGYVETMAGRASRVIGAMTRLEIWDEAAWTAYSTSQEESFADPSPRAVREAHPHWHEHDVELKALSAQQASRWAVEQTSVQNAEWDVTDAATAVTVPTHVIASDPAVYSIFRGKPAESVVEANPRMSMSVVAGAGHSPHRDKPEATIAQFLEALDALDA